MIAHRRHRGIKAWIRNTKCTYATIIIRCVLNQPINCIVGIACFINLIAFLIRIIGTHIHKLAFAHPAATDILNHHDITFLQVFFIMVIPESTKLINAIGRRSIRCSVDEDRMFFRCVFWCVNSCEEFHAIPHGDIHFLLGVIVDDPCRVCILRLRKKGQEEQRDKQLFHTVRLECMKIKKIPHEGESFCWLCISYV